MTIGVYSANGMAAICENCKWLVCLTEHATAGVYAYYGNRLRAVPDHLWSAMEKP